MMDHRIVLAIRQTLATLRRCCESLLAALRPAAPARVRPVPVPTAVARSRARGRAQ
jgi:hypothetical protein